MNNSIEYQTVEVLRELHRKLYKEGKIELATEIIKIENKILKQIYGYE